MVTTELKDQKLTISIDGKFEFDIHRDIREAYEMINDNLEEVLINFEKVDDLDSSAVGMLLQIKDRCPPYKIVAKITGCSEKMKYILYAFHLNDTFEIL